MFNKGYGYAVGNNTRVKCTLMNINLIHQLLWLPSYCNPYKPVNERKLSLKKLKIQNCNISPYRLNICKQSKLSTDMLTSSSPQTYFMIVRHKKLTKNIVISDQTEAKIKIRHIPYIYRYHYTRQKAISVAEKRLYVEYKVIFCTCIICTTKIFHYEKQHNSEKIT